VRRGRSSGVILGLDARAGARRVQHLTVVALSVSLWLLSSLVYTSVAEGRGTRDRVLGVAVWRIPERGASSGSFLFPGLLESLLPALFFFPPHDAFIPSLVSNPTAVTSLQPPHVPILLSVSPSYNTCGVVVRVRSSC
jgi:hypothetical protein